MRVALLFGALGIAAISVLFWGETIGRYVGAFLHTEASTVLTSLIIGWYGHVCAARWHERYKTRRKHTTPTS